MYELTKTMMGKSAKDDWSQWHGQNDSSDIMSPIRRRRKIKFHNSAIGLLTAINKVTYIMRIRLAPYIIEFFVKPNILLIISTK
jgi:hypothetical protein